VPSLRQAAKDLHPSKRISILVISPMGRRKAVRLRRSPRRISASRCVSVFCVLPGGSSGSKKLRTHACPCGAVPYRRQNVHTREAGTVLGDGTAGADGNVEGTVAQFQFFFPVQPMREPGQFSDTIECADDLTH
jgi:hypothetical protein